MADTYDLLTLAEAKAAINVATSDTTVDTELAQVITAASRMCDQVYGPVVTRTVTSEVHDGGLGTIWPRQTPALSVTSVTEYDYTTSTALTAETNLSKPSSGYLLVGDGHRVKLLRRSAGSDAKFPAGRGNVLVTYTAGRYASTAAVDARFKEACAVVVVHLWQHRGAGSGATGFAGEGPAFGAVPFSTDVLRQKLRAMLPSDLPPPLVA